MTARKIRTHVKLFAKTLLRVVVSHFQALDTDNAGGSSATMITRNSTLKKSHVPRSSKTVLKVHNRLMCTINIAKVVRVSL